MNKIIEACLKLIRRKGWKIPPEWTEDDARALTAFMLSPSGVRFRNIALHATLQAANKAVAKSDNLAWECGFASGYRASVGDIDSLMSINFVEDDSEGSGHRIHAN